MKLKKGLAVALTATMAFGTLTGCNNSNNGTGNETTTNGSSSAETTSVSESTSATDGSVVVGDGSIQPSMRQTSMVSQLTLQIRVHTRI